MSNSTFLKLVALLKKFQVEEQIISEKDLENKLHDYIKGSLFGVERQKPITKNIRNDLICTIEGKTFCIEIKKNADLFCVQQLDRYLPYYKDGLILVCWKASTSLKEVFKSVESQINIPVALVEIRRNQCFI